MNILNLGSKFIVVYLADKGCNKLVNKNKAMKIIPIVLYNNYYNI